MLTVTSTRPRDNREVIRFFICGSSEASSEPTRRCMSRNRLLTVFRSTETEKSSPATIALPYPVIDFMINPSTDYTDLDLCYLWNLFFLVRKLKLVKFLVLSASGQQFRARSRFDYPSCFHHYDHIRPAHCR